MRLSGFIRRGIRHYRRMNIGLAAGVALSCAILTGALIVGDSVDRTLREIALARLGRVTHALDWGNRYFAKRLADELGKHAPGLDVAGVLSLRAAAASAPRAGEEPKRANQARLIGVDEAFWRLAAEEPGLGPLGPQEAAISESVARALDLRPGADFTVRFDVPDALPLDAPLGRREEEGAPARLMTVKAVLSDAQFGRFGLAPNQQAPFNVFVDLRWLQEQAGRAGSVNLILAGGAGAATLDTALRAVMRLEDAGLRVRAHDSGVFQVESDRVFLEEEVVRGATTFAGAQASLTYLVNEISKGAVSTPYAFVEAGPLGDAPPEDTCMINQWLADTLGARAGDRIEVRYLTPSPSNTFIEQSAAFTVHAVLPMEALAAERDLAPQFPGLSDVERCADWDIGMPLDDERLKDPANEVYWNTYGQTPKLFVSFETGKRLWGTRFGSVTAVRVPAEGMDAAGFADALARRIDWAAAGMQFMPVAEQALQAVDQAMDFGGLFAGMSMFLILASLVLLALLCVFGLQRRAAEIGILKAVGWTPRRVRFVLFCETLPALLAGVFAGALAGAIYAKTLVGGIAMFWPGALAATDVRVTATLAAQYKGGMITTAIAAVVLLMASRRIIAQPARELLHLDQTAPLPGRSRRTGRLWFATAVSAFACAVAIGAYAWLAHPPDLTEPFFMSGFLLLCAALSGYAWFLARLARRPASHAFHILKIAVANLARRRGRSLGVAAMMASGCFMVMSVASMRMNLALHADSPRSGTGGFAVYGETTAPVAGKIHEQFGVDAGDMVALRLREGDDASCLNLNRARAPRLVGVDPAAFAASGAFGADWGLLDRESPDGCVPAFVGDTDTAMWGLKATTDPVSGTVLDYRDDNGVAVRVRLVGALPVRLSVFQGAVIISETSFTRLFPGEAGYRVFLLHAAPGEVESMVVRLNRDTERLGMNAVAAVERLRSFYVVETAYLAMFLVLGGLGLLLGCCGAAVVMLRNLFERRAEAALLGAVGWPAGRVKKLFFIEHVLLICSGIVLGAVSAAAAIFPLASASQTVVSFPALAVLVCALFAAGLIASAATVIAGTRSISYAALREE